MQIDLASPSRKLCFAVAVLLSVAGYIVLAGLPILAQHYANRADVTGLQRAIRLQPGNADYRYWLGRYFSLAKPAPDEAVSCFLAAVALNPYQGRYWLGLADAYQVMGLHDPYVTAIDRAWAVTPRSPEVAWLAAELSLNRGDIAGAMTQLRVVLEGRPSMAPTVFQTSLPVTPDLNTVLDREVPPNPQVYYALLDILMARKDVAGAQNTWSHLLALRQKLDREKVFPYIRFLLTEHEVDAARLGWQQAADLANLSDYQPTSANLLVNGDFSLDVLNGGFDWIHFPSPQAKLAIDPTNSPAGRRSLLIDFDARSLDDAGIRQFVPVEPNTPYELSAYFKSSDIQGAGGPQLAVEDAYAAAVLYASDDLKDANDWTKVRGTFTTGPDTRLLMVRVRRVPAGSPIKGKLWLGGLRLVKTNS